MVDVADKSRVQISGYLDAREDFSFVAPPDKSFTHRAIIFSALAKGESQIVNPLLGEDCRSTIGVFAQLGVQFSEEKAEADKPVVLKVFSPGVAGWSLQKNHHFDFGNSGTTARLLLGLFAGMVGLEAECDGDESLRRRPMGRVAGFLREMGAQISGKDDSDKLPLTISGRSLTAKTLSYDKASAQVKSALLLSAFQMSGRQVIELPAGSRDHTERFILAHGGNLQIEISGDKERLIFQGPFLPELHHYDVPGDPSSAAFLAAMFFFAKGSSGQIRQVMQNATRSGFFEQLVLMGANVASEPVLSRDCIEKHVDYTLSFPESLRPLHIRAQHIPTLIDEVPILALMLSYIDGESRIEGLSELRVKESDRLLETENLIKKTGGTCEIQGDDLLIYGQSRRTKSFTYHSQGDHRMAMAACCAALLAEDACIIEGIHCIRVSYPSFFDDLGLFAKNLQFLNETKASFHE